MYPCPSLCHVSDASRVYVNKALREGYRIGLIPGGISEMFTLSNKAGGDFVQQHEYAIIRPGFIRLAVKHNIPIIPVYCFGASKLFRQVPIPGLERLSAFLRASICIFYGVAGLPIPFEQRLMYVIGRPICPSTSLPTNDSKAEDELVDHLYDQFCLELHDLFERHKESYGWVAKTLQIIRK
jgi:1-acyl-sn-glycerol-3-phosphate acyltransferase